jgi:hypothetical protein
MFVQRSQASSFWGWLVCKPLTPGGLRWHVLWLGWEIPVWSPGVLLWLAQFTLPNDKVILPRCERVVMVWQEASINVVNGLMEPSKVTSHQETLYTGKTLVWAQWKVHVRILNESDKDQVLVGGTTLVCCEPVKWVVLVDNLRCQPQVTQVLCEQLQNVVSDLINHFETSCVLVVFWCTASVFCNLHNRMQHFKGRIVLLACCERDTNCCSCESSRGR